MKLFAVAGGVQTERTAVAEKIAEELKRRHQTVALLLSDGTETEQKADRIFRGNTMEINQKVDLEKALSYITEDYAILAYDVDMVPKLSIDGKKDELTFACTTDFADTVQMVDYIEKHAPAKMPFVFGTSCCVACDARDCRAMLADIIAGKATLADCPVDNPDVIVKINGHRLTLVQFCQNILRQTNMAILSTLNDYVPNSHVEIEILPKDE